MTTLTHLPPSASLADIIALYRRHLPEGEVAEFSVEGIDRLGLPVRIASFKMLDGTQMDGFGYGATEQEATIGALGELSEQAYSTLSMRQRKPILGSYQELRASHGADVVVDPLTLCLPAGSPYHPEMTLAWTEARRYPTGEPVLVPWECAAVNTAQMQGRRPLMIPITNGLGAGGSLDQALSHGLLELLQRDGNCVSFRAMDQGVVVELDQMEDPGLQELLRWITNKGVQVTAKLASTGFGLPNLYVVGHDVGTPSTPLQGALPIQVTACGEAVHPDRERCLRKALLEFAAARSRKAFMHGPLERVKAVAPRGYLEFYSETFDPSLEEPRCLQAMMEWLTSSREQLIARLQPSVFHESSRVKFSDLPTSPDPCSNPKDRLRLVSGQLHAEGFDVLYFDFSPPGTDLAVIKAVVPGLEGETMSYHRIGERGVRRLLERGCDFVGLGLPPKGSLRVRLTPLAEERLGSPAWLDPDGVARKVGPLYPLYREPNSHAAPLAVLRNIIPGQGTTR